MKLEMTAVMVFKKSFVTLVLVIVLVAGFLTNVKISFSQGNSSDTRGALVRNVYMFCSKSYFDKVYRDVAVQVYKSPFGFPFVVSKDYSDFFIAGFENNKLVFFYTNSRSFSGISSVKIAADANEVKKLKLSPVSRFTITKGSFIYEYHDSNIKKDYDAFSVNSSYYVYIFYDRLTKPNVVAGIFMVKKSVWDDFLLAQKITSSYNDAKSLAESFENINLLHLNSIRYYLKKPYLRFSEQMSKIAREHSQNMAKYNFFSHTDLSGMTLESRLKNAGISYRSAGENIAVGTKLLPFFANHLLLNSEGHRKNFKESFEVAAVGCAFDDKSMKIYYTQDFAVLNKN